MVNGEWSYLFRFSASEMIVTRSFPVGSLVREKRIGVQYLQHLEQWLHECIQLRSSTFQVNTFFVLICIPAVYKVISTTRLFQVDKFEIQNKIDTTRC